MTSRVRCTALMCLLTLAAISLAAPTLAQNPGGKPRFPGLPGGDAATPAAEPFNDSRDHVRATAKPETGKVAPGTDLAVAVILEIDPEWHIWTNIRKLPADIAVFGGAVNTELTAIEPISTSLTTHLESIQWPEFHKEKSDVGDGPQDYAVFAGQSVLFVPVTIDPAAKLGKTSLNLRLSMQACKAALCMAPADIDLAVSLEIVDPATLQSPVADPLFAAFDRSVFATLKSGAPAGLAATIATQPVATAQPPRPTFFGITLPSTAGALGFVILILLSMLGGFILNLTPCVLPIIPIKILTISQHAKTPGKSLVLGAWMAAGVVAFWAGIGVPAALFAGAADPSRIFGIWWVTLGIGALIAAMGVGIMGLFTIQLPAAVYSVNPKADTAWGSFLFGIMTAVLGLPCFGFVAGALLAGAATLPPVVVMAVFASIGVGMASPYLILSAKPKLVDHVPRTGPASELVKQVMGLMLLAAAAYFMGSGLITLVIEEPYLGTHLHWLLVALFATAAGSWLIIRTFQITPNPVRRLLFTCVGLVIGGVAIVFATQTVSKAKADWQSHQASIQTSDGFTVGAWNDYTPQRLAKARAAGHVVVLDFTASWCLTCQFLKTTVLDPEPVKSAFAGKDVVVFTVDLSSRKAPGWTLLHDLGKTGIPLLVIYTPGADTPWQANAYTPDQVLKAIDDARARKVAAK